MEFVKNRFPIVLITLFIFALGLGVASIATGSKLANYKSRFPKKHLKQYVDGEVLVKFKKKTGYQIKLNTISKMGGIKIQELGNTGYMQVKLGKSQKVKNAVAAYRSDPSVEYAQPNYIYHAFAAPNDTKYSQMWGLKNTGQTVSNPSYVDINGNPINNPGTSGRDMDMESAWEQITDCSSVIVAVIDTGVNYNQEDLAANMWNGGAGYPNHGYDFVNNDYDPMDLNGHGTHVAGTIGAVGNNGKGTTGVCWNVKIMAVRVLDATGSGTTAQIVSGLNFAVQRGAKVVNMSLGGPNFDTAFGNAISAARDAGVLVVVAAGNEENNVDSGVSAEKSYPCNYMHDNIVCVAALDQTYALAHFSNYGSTSVDVGAPGANIWSTWPGTTTVTTTDFTDWATNSIDDWGIQKYGEYSFLTNPKNWDGASNTYRENQNYTYANKDFGALTQNAETVIMDFLVNFDVLANDVFDVDLHNGTYVNLESFTNSTTDNYFYYVTYDITDLVLGKASWKVFYWMKTDSVNNGKGVAITDFSITTLDLNNTSYNIIDGTSMAAPHVAGLAAMLMAFNPAYTYADVAESIKNGGESAAALSGKSTTGNAANAWGSLCYIGQPTGVAAAIQ